MMLMMMMTMMMTEAVGREERFLLSVGRTRALAGRTLQAASNTLHVLQPQTTTKHHNSQTLPSPKSAKAININSNSKQRGFSCTKDYSETFRTRRQELGGTIQRIGRSST